MEVALKPEVNALGEEEEKLLASGDGAKEKPEEDKKSGDDSGEKEKASDSKEIAPADSEEKSAALEAAEVTECCLQALLCLGIRLNSSRFPNTGLLCCLQCFAQIIW